MQKQFICCEHICANWCHQCGKENPYRSTAPKPATPEPRDWQPPSAEDYLAPPRNSAWYDQMMSAHEAKVAATAQTIAPPDPIAEFNERRKAKRLTAMVPGKSEPPIKSVYRCKHCGKVTETWQPCRCNDTGGRVIARAMSAPLPHDPPMSVRLMPWRGK